MKGRIRSPLRLLWVWSVIGVASFAGPYLFFFAPGNDEHDRQGYLLGRDFVNVWFGAKQALAGKVSRIFVHSDYLADMREALGKSYPKHNFSYPPHILLLALAFGIMPYFPSLALWTVAGAAAFIAALRTNPFYKITWQALVLTLSSPAVAFNFMFGQNGAFTAAFLLGGLYLCESSPVVAGVLFGLLTVKPHLGLLVPLVLLLRRNWKCFASAAATGALLGAVSLLIWGVGPWRDYLVDTVPYQESLLNGPGNIYNPLMPGVWSDAVKLFPQNLLRLVMYGIAAIAAFASTIVIVRRDGITARSVLAIPLATLIILPYGFNYDMPAIAGALVVYLGTLADIGICSFICFGLLWALPMALVDFKLVSLPISSIILLSSLICLHFLPACGASGTRSAGSCNRPSTGADQPKQPA